MKSLKTLISFFIIVVFLVSLAGMVSAKQYIIYHDDEIDTITQLQKNSKDRQHQYVIEDLQDQINELEQQMHEVSEESEEDEDDEDDFYDCRREIRKYIRGDQDHDDFMDYLDDHAQCEDYYYDGVWDDDDWQDNDWNDYWQYDDDWYDDYADSYDDWYENCKLRPSDYYDNYDYSDYLKDLHWRGKCKRFWDTHRWYDYNTFIEKYENIDTSIDPLWNKYTWENYYSKYPWYEDKIFSV